MFQISCAYGIFRGMYTWGNWGCTIMACTPCTPLHWCYGHIVCTDTTNCVFLISILEYGYLSAESNKYLRQTLQPDLHLHNLQVEAPTWMPETPINPDKKFCLQIYLNILTVRDRIWTSRIGNMYSPMHTSQFGGYLPIRRYSDVTHGRPPIRR